MLTACSYNYSSAEKWFVNMFQSALMWNIEFLKYRSLGCTHLQNASNFEEEQKWRMVWLFFHRLHLGYVDQYKLLNSWNQVKSCTVQCISGIPRISLLIGNAPTVYCLLLHPTTFCLTWIPTVAPLWQELASSQWSAPMNYFAVPTSCHNQVMTSAPPWKSIISHPLCTMCTVFYFAKYRKKHICTWILPSLLGSYLWHMKYNFFGNITLCL